MSVKGRFSVDTNILIYAVDRDAGDRHEQSKDLIGQAAKRDCILTVQVLAEFYYATTRKNLLEPSHAKNFIHDWLNVFRIAAADSTTLVGAMEAVKEHHLSFWDAMIWAVARQAGCSVIISEDMQGGQRPGGIEILNPFSSDTAGRLESLFEA
ncbi:MAG: PIN domain-containing protein [Gammaproteobacteria bacterium]|nr:PIN domain-containing protein [Gammaproteobacteria bacterium]